MKVLHLVATGRGAQTVANDCARFLKLEIGGNTTSDYTDFTLEFRRRSRALTDGRRAEDVLKTIINSKFVMCLINFNPLSVQMTATLAKVEYPEWDVMAAEFQMFLSQKKNMEDAIKNKDNFSGTIQANSASMRFKKKENRYKQNTNISKRILICFLCGENHTANRCPNASKPPVCERCKKTHHTKAHDLAVLAQNKMDSNGESETHDEFH